MGEAKRRNTTNNQNGTIGTFGYAAGLLNVRDVKQMAEFVTSAQKNFMDFLSHVEAGKTEEEYYRGAFESTDLVLLFWVDANEPLAFGCRVAKGGELVRRGMASALAGDRPYMALFVDDNHAAYRLALKHGDEAIGDAIRDIERFVGLIISKNSPNRKRPS